MKILKELSEIKSAVIDRIASGLYKIVEKIALKIRNKRGFRGISSNHIIKLLPPSLSISIQIPGIISNSESEILFWVLKIQKIHNNMDKYYVNRFY